MTPAHNFACSPLLSISLDWHDFQEIQRQDSQQLQKMQQIQQLMICTQPSPPRMERALASITVDAGAIYIYSVLHSSWTSIS